MIAIFPQLAAAASAGEIEQLAILVRRYFGGREVFAPRPNLQALLQAAGLAVSRIDSEEIGALLAKDERGSFAIVAVVGREVSMVSERFLLAHLLGHYLLDVQPLIARGEWQVSGFREVICPLQRYSAGGTDLSDTDATLAQHDARREERADAFAAALLLPRGMVRRAAEKFREVEAVADFFAVSRACMLRRLQDIGLVAAPPANFLAAESQLAPPVPDAGQPIPTPTAAAVPEVTAMPRSYAASTYGATERKTRQGKGQDQRLDNAEPRRAGTMTQPSPASTSSPPSSPPSSQPSSPRSSGPQSGRGLGMERLREIARKLDKGVGRT